MIASAYIRVSTVRQAGEGLSLDVQEREVRDYITKQGWDLDDVFIERGVSGRKDSRPQLDRLLKRLPEIDRVVIPKLDRLGRSASHLNQLFTEFQRHKVALVSLRDNFDSATANGRMMRGLLSVLAEFEADLISERVKATAGVRVADGQHYGRAPYGYRSVKGALEVHAAEAATVRRIFTESDAGASQRDLARRLNAERVPSATGREWTQSSVRRILLNETYRGAVVIHGREHQGTHEALVSAEVWHRLQADRATKARSHSGGRGRPVKSSHLLTNGLLRCAHCGGAMLPRSGYGKDSKHGGWYLCSTRMTNGPAACPQTNVPRKAIDEAIFRQFESRALDLGAMAADLSAKAADALSDARASASGAADEAAAAERRLAVVQRAFQDEKIDADDYSSQREALLAELAAAKQRAAATANAFDRLSEAADAKSDATTAAVERIAAVRKAVAGAVDPDSIEAARQALSRIFETVWIRRLDVGPEAISNDEAALIAAHQDAAEAHGVETGEWELIPIPADDALLDFDTDWQPIFATGITLPNKEPKGFER